MRKKQSKEKKGGLIMRDLKEFIAPIKRKRLPPKTIAYNLQKAGYVDPNYKLKSPVKKKALKRKRRSKKQKYIIRGGKAYLIK